MKRRDFLAGIVGASVPWYFRTALAKQTSAVPSAPVGFQTKDGYHLVKNWDFKTVIRDYTSLRREFHTRYIYNGGMLDYLNDEWQRYRDNDNHRFTPEGLSLVARAVGELQPGAIESGMLRSCWVGKFGVFEACMQVPKGRGLWPAFWLNPEDTRCPPEIDVVEIVDNGDNATTRSFHFLHGLGSKGSTTRVSKLNRNKAYEPGFDYSKAFHVFSVEWMPDAVRHFVDGVLVCDRTYRWIHDDGLDGGNAHVLVNFAVGGHWPGKPTTTSLPAELKVAYIRVWQR
jgi:beta-glucanase (GH16 family)